MNVTDLASMGYGCGLETIGEALTMMELHWDAMSPAQWVELNFTLVVHQPDLSKKCVDVLGPEECRRQDAEMDAFFDKQAEDYDPTPWCANESCMAMKQEDCHCGPLAEND